MNGTRGFMPFSLFHSAAIYICKIFLYNVIESELLNNV